MSGSSLRARGRRLLALLCMALLAPAANVTADAVSPAISPSSPQSIDPIRGKCTGTVVRAAAPGTFVVRPAPAGRGCECMLLTGRADRQSAALERRVSNFERDPHCERVGFAQGMNDVLRSSAASSTGPGVRELSPAVVLFLGSATQLGGNKSTDSAGG